MSIGRTDRLSSFKNSGPGSWNTEVLGDVSTHGTSTRERKVRDSRSKRSGGIVGRPVKKESSESLTFLHKVKVRKFRKKFMKHKLVKEKNLSQNTKFMSQ